MPVKQYPMFSTLFYWCLAILAVLAAGWILYDAIGALFGTFRTDEIYFLQDAWSAHQGYSSLRGIPPHHNKLIEMFWAATAGDVANAWTLRVWILFAVAIQAWVVFKMVQAVLPLNRRLGGAVGVLAAAVFVVIMSAYRGYEVRPEVLPNTLILLSAYWLFFVDFSSRSRKASVWLLAATGMALIVAASFSFRHALPAFFFFLFAAYRLLSITGKSFFSLSVVIFGLWFLVFVYFNFISFDILEGIRGSSEWQKKSEARPYLERFLFGGGVWHLNAKLFLMACVLLISVVTLASQRRLSEKVIFVLIPLLSLLGFYAFLFGPDIRPFEYVRSVEWMLLVIWTCVVFKAASWAGWWRCGLNVLALLGVAGVFVVTQKEAVENLTYWRNADGVVSVMGSARSEVELNRLADKSLVVVATGSASVIEQMRARAVFCERYPTGLTLVASFGQHPICLRDVGSLALSGWEGKIDLGSVDFHQLDWFSLPLGSESELLQTVSVESVSPRLYVKRER